MPLLNDQGADADAVYLGATPVDAVYLGADKVWPAATPTPTGFEWTFLGSIHDLDQAHVPGQALRSQNANGSFLLLNNIDSAGNNVRSMGIPAGHPIHNGPVDVRINGFVVSVWRSDQSSSGTWKDAISLYARDGLGVHDPVYGAIERAGKLYIQYPA